MFSPMFSIIIPTRNRAETLRSSLATCLNQDFDDFEIIVCDNCSSEATRDVVTEIDSDRIKYTRSTEPLAMGINWERGLDIASGKYITIIGDDDGFLDFGLREAARILRDKGMPDGLHWKCGYYYWPNISIANVANYMAIPLTRTLSVYSGRDQLIRAARDEISFDELPTIYHSFIKRSIIEKHKSLTGKVFISASPDLYSACAFAFLCKQYVSISIPLHVNGASGKSNGVAAATRLSGQSSATAEIYNETSRLQDAAGFRRHPTVPNCDLWPAYFHDAFQHAKDALFPDDSELSLDRENMLRSYAAALPSRSPRSISTIMAAVSASLEDRPDLLALFSRLIAEGEGKPPAASPIRKPERLGFDGSYLLIDTVPFGVVDIAGAVALAANILQVPTTGAAFDLPSIEELSALLLQRTEQSHHLFELVKERTAQAEELSQLVIERTAQAEQFAALLADRTVNS